MYEITIDDIKVGNKFMCMQYGWDDGVRPLYHVGGIYHVISVGPELVDMEDDDRKITDPCRWHIKYLCGDFTGETALPSIFIPLYRMDGRDILIACLKYGVIL